MKTRNALISTAIAGAFALSTLTMVGTANAGDDKEKCYGVAKAGKNDCQTSNSSCAGTSTVDDQGDAFVVVPAGLCEKLTGGSTEASS